MATATRIRRAYPRFVPVRTESHPILGEIKIYEFDRIPSVSDDGAQSSFYSNHASPDNPNEYAIKVFNTSIEAFAAFQRQGLAAKEGLAPPVGKMVRWIVRRPNGKRINRWGYETCLARCGRKDRQIAVLLGSPLASFRFAVFCEERGYAINPQNNRSRIAFFANVEYRYDEQLTDTYSGALIERDSSSDSLKSRLSRINITGTQYDDLAEAYHAPEEWKKNDRLRLGSVYHSKDGAYMSGDLHQFNLGLWQGNPVCIDYGFHIASPSFKGTTCD